MLRNVILMWTQDIFTHPAALMGYFPTYCQKLRTSKGKPDRGCMFRNPLLSRNFDIA